MMMYISPEVVKGGVATDKSDIWALVLIIYFLSTGKTLFAGGTQFILFQNILSCKYTIPSGVDPKIKDLLEKVIILDPA
ncbi:MAG: hypothetical protein EZS28_056339, partial [Streblomastix strix]